MKMSNVLQRSRREEVMSESVSYTNPANRIHEASEDPLGMPALIAALGSSNGRTRHMARQSLVALGKTAVAPLIKALASPNDSVRWGAAKALEEIADPSAAEALVRALEDNNYDVRWLAAEGLIRLRRNALAPLMRALMDRSNSVWLQEGARHILHHLASNGLRRQVEPVLTALDGIEPALATPPAALVVLENLARTSRRVAR